MQAFLIQRPPMTTYSVWEAMFSDVMYLSNGERAVLADESNTYSLCSVWKIYFRAVRSEQDTKRNLYDVFRTFVHSKAHGFPCLVMIEEGWVMVVRCLEGAWIEV